MTTGITICILTPAENVDAVREAAKTIGTFSEADVRKLMAIQLSPTGDAPPTHYFCSSLVTQETLDEMLTVRRFSEIVVSDPRQFLRSRNLKVVKGTR
jgi:hypothetical protein